jgi:hypothetical protein
MTIKMHPDHVILYRKLLEPATELMTEDDAPSGHGIELASLAISAQRIAVALEKQNAVLDDIFRRMQGMR